MTDWGNARVAKYDLDGNFILSFKGPLAGPTGIAAREGEVFVADRDRGAVLRFDSSGNLLREYRGLSGPEGLAFRDPTAPCWWRTATACLAFEHRERDLADPGGPFGGGRADHPPVRDPERRPVCRGLRPQPDPGALAK